MNLVAVILKTIKPGGVDPGALALLQCDDTQAAWLLDGTFDYARYCSIGFCPYQIGRDFDDVHLVYSRRSSTALAATGMTTKKTIITHFQFVRLKRASSALSS
jgi:hypothetical protein